MTDIARCVEELLPLARSASECAYSPYSHIKVGAVVVGNDGRVFSGCNVENASFGLTQCAERNALGAAMAAGEQAGKMTTLLIYASGFESLSPCGACRQVMSELLADDARIISCCDNNGARSWTMRQLLPDAFKMKKAVINRGE